MSTYHFHQNCYCWRFCTTAEPSYLGFISLEENLFWQDPVWRLNGPLLIIEVEQFEDKIVVRRVGRKTTPASSMRLVKSVIEPPLADDYPSMAST